MRAFVKVLRRSPRVATAGAAKIMGSLMKDLDSYKPGNCNIGSAAYQRPTLRWCSSQTDLSSSSTMVQGAASPNPSSMVNQITDSATQFMLNNPQITEIAAYAGMGYISYRVLRKITLQLRLKSESYAQYEKCIINALVKSEQHVMKYYPFISIGLVAFSEMSIAIAPSMKVYLSNLWEGATIISIIWFLNVLKENFIAEAKQKDDLFDSKWLSHFDKVSSVGLIALALLGVAEAGDLSLQSMVTITGAGGVLTAFAAKDVLVNMLNGISLQFTEPFVVGEYIKAGSVEGTVVEIGLTCTSLLNDENFPLTVPNSYFTSQVIVNRSRATIRSCVITIPIKFDDVEKIVVLTQEVNMMLSKNPFVTVKGQGPCCYISRVGKLYGELVMSCETHLKNDEIFGFKQDVMIEALKIMKSHGIDVGDPLPSGDLEALLEAAKIIKSREAFYSE